MITVTDIASAKIKELIDAQPRDNLAVRIRILGRGVDSFAYSFHLVETQNRQDGDLVLDTGKFELYVDPETAPLLEESVIDYNEASNGFKIENPNPVWEDEVGPKVARIIEEKVNPGVASHGGAILLMGVRDNVAYVRMFGGCQGCGMASTTLYEVVEKEIKASVPEIVSVVDVTRHALGTNPYYK